VTILRLSDQRLMTPALGERGVDGHNTPSAADLGIRRDEIHDARPFRDAERPDPDMRRAKGEGLGETIFKS
jgi:hypothetical protein